MNSFLSNMLAGIWNDADSLTSVPEWLKILYRFMDQYILGISIILMVAAVFMSIFIGVSIAKQEDAGKAKALKNRLIGLIVTILLVIGLVWLFHFMVHSWDEIQAFFDSIKNNFKNPNTENNDNKTIFYPILTFFYK